MEIRCDLFPANTPELELGKVKKIKQRHFKETP